MRLGLYEFPFDPPVGDYSGLQKVKSRTDVQTFSNNISLNWGFVLQDNNISMQWNIMKKDFYKELENRYLNNNGANTYEFEMHDGRVFEVEIVNFGGTPYGEFYDEQNIKGYYYKDISLKLKVLNEVV